VAVRRSTFDSWIWILNYGILPSSFMLMSLGKKLEHLAFTDIRIHSP
jgi:hypothetical protein